jgi:hypothetical protein
MPLPTVDEAYQALQQAPAAGAIQIDVQLRIARLAAAVQADSARTIADASTAAANTVADASEALRDSVDAFTAASQDGAVEAVKWSKQMTFATWALLVAAVIQAIAAVAQVIVALAPP